MNSFVFAAAAAKDINLQNSKKLPLPTNTTYFFVLKIQQQDAMCWENFEDFSYVNSRKSQSNKAIKKLFVYL